MNEEPRTWRVTYHPRFRVAYPEPMRVILQHEEQVVAADLTRQQADALVVLIRAEDRDHG